MARTYVTTHEHLKGREKTQNARRKMNEKKDCPPESTYERSQLNGTRFFFCQNSSGRTCATKGKKKKKGKKRRKKGENAEVQNHNTKNTKNNKNNKNNKKSSSPTKHTESVQDSPKYLSVQPQQFHWINETARTREQSVIPTDSSVIRWNCQS